MNVQASLLKTVLEGIEIYNRYRAPEAQAELLRIEGDKVFVLFKGSFTETCGINDWIMDMIYVLEDEGLKARLLKIHEPMKLMENWRIGEFQVKLRGSQYSL